MKLWDLILAGAIIHVALQIEISVAKETKTVE